MGMFKKHSVYLKKETLFKNQKKNFPVYLLGPPTYIFPKGHVIAKKSI